MPSEATLAQRIRSKYPGAYDDMDDQSLEAAILKKYPGTYDDLPRSQAATAPAPTGATIGADNRGMLGRARDAALNMQGIPGVIAGAASQAFDGVAGLGDMARAGWNMLAPDSLDVDRPAQRIDDIPAMNPYQQLGQRGVQAAEIAGGVKALTKVPGVVAKGLGISKVRGGANMGTALEAGKELRVPLTKGTQDAAMRARELVGSRNAELNTFFDRLTNPKVTKYRGDDLAVREAQDFVSKFSAMSAEDVLKLPQSARPELAKLASELRAALTNTLDTVGKGGQYESGVNEYRRAMRAAEIWEGAKPWLKKLGYVTGAGWGAGAAIKEFGT
jgi:hypothetical protein